MSPNACASSPVSSAAAEIGGISYRASRPIARAACASSTIGLEITPCSRSARTSAITPANSNASTPAAAVISTVESQIRERALNENGADQAAVFSDDRHSAGHDAPAASARRRGRTIRVRGPLVRREQGVVDPVNARAGHHGTHAHAGQDLPGGLGVIEEDRGGGVLSDDLSQRVRVFGSRRPVSADVEGNEPDDGDDDRSGAHGKHHRDLSLRSSGSDSNQRLTTRLHRRWPRAAGAAS